ncbi:MAG: hypothetical protein ACI8Q6_003770, partial [Granulosicoccus sp.]
SLWHLPGITRERRSFRLETRNVSQDKTVSKPLAIWLFDKLQLKDV